MIPILQLPSQTDQTNTCLRGLLTSAWADGQLDVEKQKIISGLTTGVPSDTVRPSTLMQAKASEPEPSNYSLNSGVSYPIQVSLSGEHASALLNPAREWLDHLEIHDPRLARFLCKIIPPQCPFERDIHLFGHKVAHIPPLCKINPLYEQLVGLRFRALSYLADDCGEDISSYC